MNFNFDLFIDVLWLGTLSGIISTICLQKLKDTSLLKYKSISILINIIIGFFISRLFTNLSIKLSICVGVITWIGAETIYDKIYSKNLMKKEFITENSNEEEIELEDK